MISHFEKYDRILLIGMLSIATLSHPSAVPAALMGCYEPAIIISVAITNHSIYSTQSVVHCLSALVSSSLKLSWRYVTLTLVPMKEAGTFDYAYHAPY